MRERMAVGSGNPTSGYLSTGKAIGLLKRCLRPVFTCSIFHNSHDTTAAYVPVDGRISKEDVLDRERTHTVEHSSASQKKESLSFTTTWMNVGNITPREVSQAQKDKHGTIALMCGT